MPYDLSYEYDAVGNRTRKVDNLSAAVTTYSYDAANQLQTSQDLFGTTTYTYDGAGNLKVIQAPASQTTTYSWDAWNRRTKVELPGGGVVTSVYNSDGLRVLKEEPGGVVRKYLWDLQNYLVEYDGAGDVAVEYINKPERYGKLIAQKRAGEASPDYFHFDALGSTIALTDSSQTVLENYQYDAWGQRLSINAFVPSLLYVGHFEYYRDETTAEDYVRLRFYSPAHGRWISRDKASTMSLQRAFVYSDNSPVLYIDPSGLVCATPQGVQLVPGRGQFSVAQLLSFKAYKDFMKRRNVGVDDVGEISSGVVLEWKPTNAAFRDPAGGCCCCEIAWVQIAKGTHRRANFVFNIIAHALHPFESNWFIDYGVPYADSPKDSSWPNKIPVSGNPCTLTTAIGMSDVPGYSDVNIAWVRQDFFTCVVCLRGKEFRTRSALTGRRELVSMGVYGCALWGHLFERKDNGGWNVNRTIETDVAPIEPFKKLLRDYYFGGSAFDVYP